MQPPPPPTRPVVQGTSVGSGVEGYLSNPGDEECRESHGVVEAEEEIKKNVFQTNKQTNKTITFALSTKYEEKQQQNKTVEQEQGTKKKNTSRTLTRPKCFVTEVV
jgi:hypothetical protein